MIAELAYGAGFGLAGAFVLRTAFVGRIAAQEKQSLYIDRFYEVANRLADNPGLNDDRLRTLAWYSQNLQSWRAMIMLLRALHDVESARDVPVAPLPKDIEQDWIAMFICWAATLSFRYPVLGVLVRSRLLRILDPSEPDKEQMERAIESRIPKDLAAA